MVGNLGMLDRCSAFAHGSMLAGATVASGLVTTACGALEVLGFASII